MIIKLNESEDIGVQLSSNPISYEFEIQRFIEPLIRVFKENSIELSEGGQSLNE